MPSSPEVVPFFLTDSHRNVLREDCLSALQSILEDLTTPERVRDPAATAREGEIFRRLLEALDRERIEVPDEELRERITRLAESYDRMSDAEEVITTHAAHRAVLRVLEGSREEGEAGEEDEAMGSRAVDETDRRREVLALLLAESPHSLSLSEVAVALAGDPEDPRVADDLRNAASCLVGAGLARRQGGALAPTRPAREMVGLGFSIG